MASQSVAQELVQPRSGLWSLSPERYAAVAAAAAVFGLCSIWPAVLALWTLWTEDALKSIGMVVPVVSFVLVLWRWRALGWYNAGSWWGLALLAGTAALVRLREGSVMTLVLAPQWSMRFPPVSVVMLLYGVGAVLLFGGVQLVRACRFPLGFLLLVNPVPRVFNVYVDLPLQRLSAHVARGFAMALGQPLSPDKLRLMFTPQFGMFIAPGCNGIRGAVTMGMIALVAGYLYRFRPRLLALVVLAAVLLGYGFNLLRLCALVLYYLLALHLPGLQARAENADYLIGAALFFAAVYLLYSTVQRLGGGEAGPEPAPMRPRTGSLLPGVAAYGRVLALLALGLAGCGTAYQVVHARELQDPALQADAHAPGNFPQTLGEFTLTRTWNENLLTGALLYHWADYAPPHGGTHIQLGVSPRMGAHDTMVCHSARGEDPLWHGENMYSTAGDRVSFSTSVYNDGATEYLEAATLCSGTACGEYSSPRTHFGFTYSRIDPSSVLTEAPERPIPILLKAETMDTTLPLSLAREQLSADMARFLAHVDLGTLLKPYRRS